MLIKSLIIILLLFFNHSYAERNPFTYTPTKQQTRYRNSTYVIPIPFKQENNLKKILMQLKQSEQLADSFFSIDAKNHNLIIITNKATAQKIKNITSKLRLTQQQILIKAKIINIDCDAVKQLGINLFSGIYSSNTKNNTANIPILRFRDGSLLDIRLHALERTGKAEVISQPMLFTLNQQTASIESGAEIPYQQSTRSGATSIAFRKAVLKLNVTPSILANNKILLNIQVNQDSVSHLTVNGEPAIKTQQLTTAVILNNNESAILGGIFNTTTLSTTTGIPLLKDIPLFGALFRDTHTVKEHKELLLVVSPEIIVSKPKAYPPQSTKRKNNR